MDKKREVLDILMQYIKTVDPAGSNYDGIISKITSASRDDRLVDYYTDDDIFGDDIPAIQEPEKKVRTFTEEQLLDIIATLPQPGGYIHIDDLTKAITNGGDTK